MKRIRMFIARCLLLLSRWVSPIYLTTDDTEEEVEVLKRVTKKAKVVDMSPLIEI